MANAFDLDKKCFFLLTGGSRGIGQAIAVACARKLKAGSVVVLLARSAEGLEVTRQQILDVNAHINVVTCSLDLTRPSRDQIADVLAKSLLKCNPTDFEMSMIVHNVGTIGDVSVKAKHLNDYTAMTDYFSCNVFGVVMLNGEFVRTFADTKHKLIVNITSKAAVQPFNSFAYYCAGKAAREMYFRVLAQEEPNLVVLNYSPGPVDTDMTVTVQAESSDAAVRDLFKSMRETATILKAHETADRFVAVVTVGNYASGDHVDYYD